MPNENQRNAAKELPQPDRSSLCATGIDVGQNVFRDLVDAAQCMILVLCSKGTIEYCNTFATDLTGYAPDEILGRHYFECFVPKTVRAEVQAGFHRVLAGASGVEIEHPLLARGAPLRWVVSSFRRFTSCGGSPAVLLTAQDITVRKHTEVTLQQRTHDLGERIKELNCLFGLSKLVEVPGIDLDGILQGLANLLPPGWQYPDETCGRVIFEGREYKTYNFRETPWRQAAPITVYGTPSGMIEVFYLEQKPDSHEGPFLAEERRLLNALAKQLGQIAERIKAENEISEISTREQQRIGQELHDGLGQELTGLGYLAQTLFCDLKDRQAAEAETANELADGIERALEQARTIAKGLASVEIEADGLVSALQQLTTNTQQRCGIVCRFHCTESAFVGDTATATQLFRIVQEAINNAAKHAQAKTITVSMDVNDSQTIFRIHDDGVGIPKTPEPTTGMGLRIMQHRAGVIGAELTVAPVNGGGTLVSCRLPVSRTQQK